MNHATASNIIARHRRYFGGKVTDKVVARRGQWVYVGLGAATCLMTMDNFNRFHGDNPNLSRVVGIILWCLYGVYFWWRVAQFKQIRQLLAVAKTDSLPTP